jgi:plastocyanin
MSRLATLLVLAFFVLLEGLAPAAEIRGRIRIAPEFQLTPLFEAPGYWQLPNDVMEVQPPMVDARLEMVVELKGSGLPKRALVKPVLRIADSRFMPPVLPVKSNAKITIINKDTVGHLLETEGQRAERVSVGDEMTRSFAKAGTYRIGCTEVPHLVAEVFVSDAPVITLPDAGGNFAIPDIPSGSYILRIWYRGQLIYREPVAAKGTIRVDVDLKQRPAAKGKGKGKGKD